MKKEQERSIRKLVKVGGGKTYSVTLPIELVRQLGWQSGQKVEIKKHGDGILIKDWKR